MNQDIRAAMGDCATDLHDIHQTIEAIHGKKYVKALESLFTVTNLMTYQHYLLSLNGKEQGTYTELKQDGRTLGIVHNGVPVSVISETVENMAYAFAELLSGPNPSEEQINAMGMSLGKDLDTLMIKRSEHSIAFRKKQQ